MSATATAVLLGSRGALAATEAFEAPRLDGASLSLAWGVPFLGLLLSIGLVPIVSADFWHRHYGKVSAFWALAFVVPFTVHFGTAMALYELIHVAALDYVPFLALLGSLFVVSGGLRIKGDFGGTPAANTGMLLVGTALASWTGTTGAAMLLVRPLIRANAWRRKKTHVVIFLIYLVANVGGALTPLGDPPLFIGFLKGVPFSWTLKHMAAPMLLAAAILLIVFFVMDRHLFQRELRMGNPPPGGRRDPFGLEGTVNLALLGAIIGVVLLSGLGQPAAATIDLLSVPVDVPGLARTAALLAIALASLALTRREVRRANGFSWFPIVEVAKLFAAIFVTVVPVMAILRAGPAGGLAWLTALVGGGGRPDPALYFWLTGVLSSILDNAPTYLVFFEAAGGDAQRLVAEQADTLLAISAGAVLMGANTYIGNAPNFMVRSIAVESGVAMPGFFGFVGWGLVFLVPIWILTTVVFFL